jgi:hypothetical protein
VTIEGFYAGMYVEPVQFSHLVVKRNWQVHDSEFLFKCGAYVGSDAIS